MSEFIIEHPFDRITIKNSLEEKEFLNIFVDIGEDGTCFDLDVELAKELVQYLTDKINKAEPQEIITCKTCGIFVFTTDGTMCMNGHLR